MPAEVSVPISLFSPSGAVMPTTASTCCAIRYSAHECAALASYFESHHTYLTWRPLMPPCWKARTVITPSTEATTKEQAMRETATRSLILRATTGPSECDLLGMLSPGPGPALRNGYAPVRASTR